MGWDGDDDVEREGERDGKSESKIEVRGQVKRLHVLDLD